MNAYRRLHGLILPYPELDLNLIEDSTSIGGADRTMSRPNPRRVHVPKQRFSAERRLRQHVAQEFLPESDYMNALSSEPDVRQALVRRVRQEILAGTYDTPEKFEAALDRMANCFDCE